MGQSGTPSRYLTRIDGSVVHFTDSGILVTVPGSSETVSMVLAGRTRATRVIGHDQLSGVANYLLGNDASKWRVNIPTFARLTYSGAYAGIDLTYYGAKRQLEYDFTVAAGAYPSDIRVQVSNGARLTIDRRGNLTIRAKTGNLILRKPSFYQLVRGRRTPVQGRFRLLARNSFGFEAGAYDHNRELVIDPVLSYATYFGGPTGGLGSSQTTSRVTGIAVDQGGNAYLTGSNTAPDFAATAGSFQTGEYAGKNGRTVAFVTKMNASGTALVYSTYLGGSANDSASGIAVDSAGRAYVGGTTNSTDFPTTSGAYQQKPPFTGSTGSVNSGFITALSADGASLIYSTYLGPFGGGSLKGIALGPTGEVFATGNAATTNFPTTAGVYQTAAGDFLGNGLFVAKLSSNGSTLVYSTFIHGKAGEDDTVRAIAVDAAGSAYVTGQSDTATYPVTTGAYQTQRTGGGPFVTKLSPDAKSLVYSTFLGTGGSVMAIAVDAQGNGYVTGSAAAAFPTTTGAYQTVGSSGSTFLTKLNPTGSSLVYSSYIGSNNIAGGLLATGLVVDSSGNAYVTGYSSGINLPVTTDAFQKTTPNTSVYLFQMNAAGSVPVYATYFGANLGGYNLAAPSFVVAVDNQGGIYLAGAILGSITASEGAARAKHSQGAYDGFVAKFGPAATVAPIITAVTNGASSASGVVPGSYASIYGRNFTTLTGTWSDAIVAGALPTELNGVSVTVGGQAAYITFISPGQINILVPNNAGTGPKTVIVKQPAGTSAPFTTTSSVYSPAFFLLPGNQPVATHLDYTLAVKAGTYPTLPTIAAKPGEIVILWGTGFGPTTPATPQGTVVPADNTYATATLPSVNISNLPATVFGAALAPGFAGLYQIAVKVPETLADGTWPIITTIGGVSSEAGISIVVQH